MSVQSRRTTHPPANSSAPALVAVTTTAARAERAATPHTALETVPGTLSVTASPGPVIGSVCTGYGGLDLGVLAALGGGRIAWCADSDPHIAQILTARMPSVPNLGDIRGINWRGIAPVEVFTAGFPCQDISAAGRRVGIEKGTRSGLWTDIVAGIRVLRPALVVLENVAALRWRAGGLHRVLGDLAEAGYDALWRSVRAADIGAAHRRERVFLLAWPRNRTNTDAAHPTSPRRGSPRSSRPRPSPCPRTTSEPARRSERDRQTPAHPHSVGREELHPQDAARWAGTPRRSPDADGPRNVAADPTSDRRDEGRPGATRLQRRPHAALSGHAPARPERRGRHLVAVPASTVLNDTSASASGLDWGAYTPAVRRWERVLGRRAPFPTQPGRHGRPVLAPTFVEWLQGLEPGWVTDLPLPRTVLLRALGNGVVPQQAAHAVSLLLDDLAALVHTGRQPGWEVAAA